MSETSNATETEDEFPDIETVTDPDLLRLLAGDARHHLEVAWADFGRIVSRLVVLAGSAERPSELAKIVDEHESTKVEHRHIWTTGGDDDNERVPLAVPEGHSVYFDCGAGGVILVSIEQDSLDLYGEMGDLSVCPKSDAEVRVTVV
jgi:hypothetical protein